MNRLSFHAAVAALIVPGALAVAAASPASASTTRAPIVTGVHTLAAFNYAAGQQPENVTVNPDRSLTVSQLGFQNGQPPALLRISPSGQQTVLVTGLPGEAIGGNARGSDGSICRVLSRGQSQQGGEAVDPAGQLGARWYCPTCDQLVDHEPRHAQTHCV